MNERRGARPSPAGPAPHEGPRRAVSRCHLSRAVSGQRHSPPAARRPPPAARRPQPAARRRALTVPQVCRCSRRTRVSERARAGAPRAAAPGLGFGGRSRSGFGMLRRPRARAPLPHTHSRGVWAGRARCAGVRRWLQAEEGRGGGSGAAPGPEGEYRTKGGAGLSPGGHGGKVPGPPHVLFAEALASDPRAWEAAGMSWEARRRMARTLSPRWWWARALGGAAWQCFPGPRPLLPFLCGACLVPRCHSVHGSGRGGDLFPRLTH